MLNSKIKDYLIQRELGRGGMAVVYLAHDNKFDTNVAVKLLNKDFVNNDNIRKRFLAEARNMFRMSHPNIIKVTDLIDDGDTVAFVMEYIEGETLKDYLERKGKLGDVEIKSLLTQMLDALGYVHEQKLVHRDIKPSNFIITPNGKVKLMDFGIAKNTDSISAEYTQTGTSMQMGTPSYMSPEQVNSSKEVGPTSDIYSLGVVLWQMITGEKPYDIKTLSIFQIQTKIVQEPLRRTNTPWDTIIQKATEKEIVKRFSNFLDFKFELNKPRKNGIWDRGTTVFDQNDDQTILEKKESNKKNPHPKPKDNKTSQTPEENKNLSLDPANKITNSSSTFRNIGIIAILLIGIFLWKKSNKTSVSEDENVTHEDLPRISHPDDAVGGDFNGDGKIDYMWLQKPRLSSDRNECVEQCVSYIKFDDTSIPSIEVLECIGGNTSNLGDLNNNGTDEIGLLPESFNSCWRDYHVWTLKDGRWESAVEPFPTHCNQWENGIKPIEIDPTKNGNVIIRFSDFNSDFDIVTKTKSIDIVN
jgi:serine/threonine protein kinase